MNWRLSAGANEREQEGEGDDYTRGSYKMMCPSCGQGAPDTTFGEYHYGVDWCTPCSEKARAVDKKAAAELAATVCDLCGEAGHKAQTMYAQTDEEAAAWGGQERLVCRNRK